MSVWSFHFVSRPKFHPIHAVLCPPLIRREINVDVAFAIYKGLAVKWSCSNQAHHLIWSSRKLPIEVNYNYLIFEAAWWHPSSSGFASHKTVHRVEQMDSGSVAGSLNFWPFDNVHLLIKRWKGSENSVVSHSVKHSPNRQTSLKPQTLNKLAIKRAFT